VATDSGHGKAILLGEHVVLEGAPALVCGLMPGIECRPRSNKERPSTPTPAGEARPKGLWFSVSPWDLEVSLGDESLPSRALFALRESLAESGCAEAALNRGYDCRAHIPSMSGLGSSAALAVALSRAILRDAEDTRHRDLEFLERMVASSEKIFHGEASGVDAALAVRGGVGRFVRGKGLRPLSPKRDARIVVAYAGAKPPTREAVAHVRARCKSSSRARRALQRLGDLSTRGCTLLEEGDLEGLGESMQEAHSQLCFFELSTPTLDRLAALMLQGGAFGAKLTGAGGGGCLIGLSDEEGALRIEATLKNESSFVATFPLSPKPDNSREL